MKLRAEVYTDNHLNDALNNNCIEMVYAPYTIIKSEHFSFSERIILIPPVYLSDCESNVIKKFRLLKQNGFNKVLVHTIGHIELFSAEGFELFGGYRLNCVNSDAVDFFYENNVTDIIVSPEMTAAKISSLINSRVGFLAYGYLPLMITRRCPINNSKPCNKSGCKRKLTDRKGNILDIICSENTAEILNSDVLYLADKLESFINAEFAVLKFTTEKNINHIISAYVNEKSSEIKNFTRGLYFRGVEV